MFEQLKEDYLKMKLEQKIDIIIDFLKQKVLYAEYITNYNNFYIISSICGGKNCVYSIEGITKTIQFNTKEYILNFSIDPHKQSYTINGFDIKTLLGRKEENIVNFIQNALPHLLDEIFETLMDDQKKQKEKILKLIEEKKKIEKQNFKDF